MSIPPLVCSTPPPPDQCEDDKDPEDFELSYSLSQEDDDDDADNGYNYGNFTSYDDFKTTPVNKHIEINQEITENIESEVQKEIYLKYDGVKETECNNAPHDVFRTNDINENKLKCDEDLSIEDLNLKVDDEIVSIVESNSDQNEISEPNIGSVKDFDIPSNSNNDSPTCNNTNASPFDENISDITEALKELNTNFVEVHELPIKEVLPKEHLCSDEEEISVPEEKDLTLDDTFKLEQPTIYLEEKSETTVQSLTVETKPLEKEIDDDFGDFDDFQSVNTKSNVINITDTSSNPWENIDSNESGFSNFTANFEEKKFQNVNDLSTVEPVSVSNNVDQLSTQPIDTDNFDDDDDFGDFDDFKSSSAKAVSNEFTTEEPSCQEMPVLNLQSTENEHQIMESITKVLSSVFLEEISEPENGFEGTLESLLSETWGHLMETDERQPYIVNWNNSLGQKTLLKALCIDSRNILFGPKWSSSMPKYAANLSNAPLQPQKQASVSSSIVTQNEILSEKPSSKTTTWTDPFTSDGQESCNTENESASITPGPTDLDVFEAAVSTKPDKIYSNTIDVQPLRQINLPDTHIFTPTDSEIPRSKTIHYDRGPTVLMPQPVMGEKNNITSNTNCIENSRDDEYWEFQNFKSTSDTSSLSVRQQPENSFETATVVTLPKPNVAYQTDLLQPIKVEPAMPALNWPDPGEIKAGYDDFSEFVSISSQPTENKDSTIQPTEHYTETNNIKKLANSRITNDNTDVFRDVNKPDDGFDDDFDTFQSALPSKSSNDFKATYSENTTNQISDFGSPNFDSMKSDTISFPNILRPNEALTQNLGYISNSSELTKSSLPPVTQIQTNLLQPTPASFNSGNTQSQQKSAQILQPLSLESYSQINWPSPGIDLQDLSRFNPVETLNSLKSDLSTSGLNKGASPVHAAKNSTVNQEDDVWGEFVSSKPKLQQQSQPKKPSTFVDDDEWTDFISSPSVKPQNGLNTISLNVHTNSNKQSVKNKFAKKSNQPPLDIPTLNYITPKANSHKSYNDKHFQNL